MTLPSPAVELLNHPEAYATVVTLNADGSPQVTLVWVEAVDGVLSFNTAIGRLKERNLRRDPRVVVSVLDPNGPGDYAVFRGTARLTEEGADEQIDRLSLKYTGRQTYAGRTPGMRRVRVDVDVERVSGRGPWLGA